ncbi:MAG TPA: cyclic nucleotide-binding domain-containing protein [Magnetospirillaceae bacterium]|nr:cyclic nucleotide-binding domain-containing protein [Magnetospirillaceae bacterium]
MRKVLFIMGQLDDHDVQWLADNGDRKRFSAGAELVREGQPNQYLYIILDGHAAVRVAGIGEVARLGAGELIGEMSLVDAAPPSASVAAVDELFVLEVDYGHLRAKVESDAGFGLRLFRAIAIFLSDRLRGTTKRLGFGEDTGLVEDVIQEGELDMNVLDTIHLAGTRFDMLLKTLSGARQSQQGEGDRR